MATGFIIVVLCFTFLYPYPIKELTTGLQQHSKNVVFNRVGTNNIKNFLRFYIVYPITPLLLFNYVLAIVYIYNSLIKKKKILPIAFFTFLIGIILFFCSKDMGMYYNLLVLTPLCFFILFVIITKIADKTLIGFLPKSLPIILIILLALNSIGFIRKSMLFFGTEDKKVSYKDFRKNFINIYNIKDKDKKISISCSLWPFCLDKWRDVTISTTDPKVQYLMIQQLHFGLAVPEAKTGFKVIRNDYITEHPHFKGIGLGNTYPWFQTAIYKRQ